MKRDPIPKNLCQWCYSHTGRFILDCFCIVCENCLNMKKSWVSNEGKCFCCDRKTVRKIIDLKTHSTQVAHLFANPTIMIRNLSEVNQFQQDIAKKYCRHLQNQISKYQSVIKKFLQDYPDFKHYFMETFTNPKNSKASMRSKSSFNSSTHSMMFANRAFENVVSERSARTIRQDFQDFIPQQQLQNRLPYQNKHSRQQTSDSYSKMLVRRQIEKKSAKLPNQIQRDALYRVNGNQKKNSYPNMSKSSLHIENMNMQTALRSSRSQRNNQLDHYPTRVIQQGRQNYNKKEPYQMPKGNGSHAAQAHQKLASKINNNPKVSNQKGFKRFK